MRGSDKEYGEYKNEKLFLIRKNGKKWGNIRMKIGPKVLKNG